MVSEQQAQKSVVTMLVVQCRRWHCIGMRVLLGMAVPMRHRMHYAQGLVQAQQHQNAHYPRR